MSKLYCPICYRLISTTSGDTIKRHGFRKNRQSSDGTIVDGRPCEGTGRTGLSIKQAGLVADEINKRNK